MMWTTDATRYIASYNSARRQWLLGDCVRWLTTLGIVQAWIAAVLFAQGLTTGIDQWGNKVVVENKSIFYYLLHGGAMASLALAGVLAGINGAYQRLDTLARLSIWILILTSTIWAIVSYGLDEIISPTILGATGPFVWLSVIMMFAGAEQKVWDSLKRLIDPMVIITAILGIGSIYGQLSDSPATVLRVNHYFCLLFWYAGWRCLERTGQGMAWISIDSGLLAVLAILALWLRRRSWVIDTALLISIYLYSLGKRSIPRGTYLLAVAMIATVPAVLLTIPSLRQSMVGLMARLNEDTRTEQYRIFFSQVKLDDLILGLGPKATYYYGPDSPRYQFFDNAYIWMAFIGGLPILICYCILILRPGLVALLRKEPLPNQVRACAIMLGIWALVLGGLGVFSCPSLNAYHYLICLMAGLCWASLDQGYEGKLRRSL